MCRQSFLVPIITAVVVGTLPMIPERRSEADAAAPRPSAAARAVVEALNALVPSDVGVAVAASTPCALDRLPGSLAGLLPLVPVEHRALVEECVRGRLRVRRRVAPFDPLVMLDEPIAADEAVAPIHDFFSGRPVDVVEGAGLSEGPYPISFDWALVLDPRSQTLFSFVLNCRD